MRTKTAVFTNMILIRDQAAGRILMQERVKAGWAGITLPGGHLEPGESLQSAAVREALEETGLRVESPRFCGICHWCMPGSDDRYLIFLYRAESYTGELLPATREGRLFWVDEREVYTLALSSNMEYILPIVLGEGAQEAFGEWVEDFSAPMHLL